MHLTHLRLAIIVATLLVIWLVALEVESCGGGGGGKGGGGKKGGWKKEKGGWKKEKGGFMKEKKKAKSVRSSMGMVMSRSPEKPSFRATVGKLVSHHIARHSEPHYDYEVEASRSRRVSRPIEPSYRDPDYRPARYRAVEDYAPPPGYEERRVLVPVDHTIVAKPRRRQRQPVYVDEEDGEEEGEVYRDASDYRYERPYASRYS